MCKKLICLFSFVLVLGLVANMANADITTDLVGYWKLDDNANDSSGNGYHGEEFGSPSYVPGMIGQAMEFNGSQSIYIPEFTGIQNQDEVTVCMWVKADRNTGADQVMWFTNEDGSYGRVRFGINGDEWEWKHGGDGGNPNVDDGENPIILGEWTHLAGVRKNNDRLELFVNGISVDQTAFGVAGVARAQGSIGSERRSPTSVRDPFEGTIDEVRVYTRVLSAADIQELFMFTGAPRAVASNPDPADEATDVPRDTVLSWTPGEFAPPINGHMVYISENFSDVNDRIGGIAQDASSYAPGQRLDFSTTYYWRVDEVNGAPDYTVYDGTVWSFTTEPVGYVIENITATASSNEVNKGPENTINGSGLDANDLHSMEPTDMWLSGTEPLGAWIEFQFDKVYKLHQMWVWNSNDSLETVIGLGLKDVSIEYSVNGTDYTTLGTTHEFARAPGVADYAHNTTVDFSGVAAKYIKLTANSNWGGILSQYGLSEVRFFYIPVWAREPDPDSGATDVDPDVVLSWRAGREAVTHDVYLSTDEQAVIDGTAPVATMTEAGYDAGALELSKTYYWKIDEVNEAETPTTWESEVWNFTTPDSLIVDDFESYNDLDPTDPESNRIFNVWIDGYDVPTNGSLVGYDVPPFTEQSIVYSGEQSMPFFYSNIGGAAYSEAELPLSPAQDWTKHGVKALSLWFHGDPNNTAEQIYVKVNGSKAVYDGDAADIKQASWQQWNVDLASFAVDLRNITKLSIGVGDEAGMTPGGSGKVLFDDIRLYPSRCILSRRSADFAKLDYVEDCVVNYGEFEVMAEEWLLEELIPGGAGEIWFEAESADTITSPMEIFDNPSASGGKCIGTTDDVGNSSDSPPPDGIATYNFTVQGGTYKISCRIIIPSGDSFWVRIPGATNLIPGEDPDNPGTGWVRWSDPPDSENWYWADVFSGDHDEEVANWTLPAGAHTLEIARREDGALLDRFVITDNLDLAPVTLSAMPADLNEDKRVDFKDYAILADAWLDEQLWPAP